MCFLSSRKKEIEIRMLLTGISQENIQTGVSCTERRQMPNLEYKSDVFSMLLQDKKNALEIYNALNETNYKDSSLVEMQSLSSGISLSIRNDASFIVSSYLNLYEHQSTFNPNMPVRSLFYISRLLEKLLKEKDLFGRKLIRIPNVKCIVFYNGLENQPEKRVLRLSDALEHPDRETDIELICTVYNINTGYNAQLMNSCGVLRDYMTFVNYVREFGRGYQLEKALNLAIDRCVKEHVLAEFFRKRRGEVLKSFMLDYTFERRMELIRRDSYQEGEAQGRAEGEARAFQKSVQELERRLGISTEEAMDLLGVTAEQLTETKGLHD